MLSGFAMSKMMAAELRIDHVHCRAICDEIGDRLRHSLTREVADLPPRLKLLVDRFAQLENEVAPSIVPTLEDMVAQGEPQSSL
jgi:hypothetical protein